MNAVRDIFINFAVPSKIVLKMLIHRIIWSYENTIVPFLWVKELNNIVLIL